jgi:uncharacterized protein YbjT (DUF2867 family)
MSLVLLVGAGKLGTAIAKNCVAEGLPVRILARTPSKVDESLTKAGVEVVQGDLDDEASLLKATAGVHTIVSALQGEATCDPSLAKWELSLHALWCSSLAMMTCSNLHTL